MDTSTYQTVPLLLPSDGLEVDTQLSILHLIKAYGEAMEMEMKYLAEEILTRLEEKGCLGGSALERLAYYLFQALGYDKHEDFLRKEAGMNYEIAFNAFYQIFPYGRFAHFTANSVILEAIPENAEILHIVDFDIDKGVQWPSMFEALALQGKLTVRLTSIKWEEEGDTSFEETKFLLYEHARNFGLRLKVEEMDLELLGSEMKTTKQRNVWLAFNCMVGLPHMEKTRSARNVIEFLKIAKDSINIHCNGSSQGTITFGDGIGWGKGLKGCGYGSIFEGQMSQFKALLESIDTHFSHHLIEARIAIECLFLIPYIYCLTNIQMWEDISRESRALSKICLEPWRMTKDNLMEAKELVREEESSYWVSIEGLKQNQMVLGYMVTPLVKVSSWR